VEISLSELAALTGGQFASEADGPTVITGAASLNEAQPGQVTFFGNAKYLPQLRQSRATAVLVPADFADSVPAICIRCENPTLAFSKVLERFAPAPVVFPKGIHPTAVIAPGAKIGADVSIQPYVVIEEGASIGDRTVIGAHSYIGHNATVGADSFLHPRVTVAERCLVGNRTTIHSGTVLGSDGFGYEFQGGRHVKIPQTGIVQVDDDVEIGANVTIDRARFGRTWIGSGTKIDNLVQIAHNVVVGQHCLLISQVGIAGSTKLGNYVTVAGQSGLNGHIEIGDQCIIGGQTGVAKSLPPKMMVMGNPAIPAKEYREQVAHIHSLPRLKARVARLEQLLGDSSKTSTPET
jgi:UDP-3-O-[3-hydroxymyristoyl] glucosamine N-acyltransferase